MAQASSNVRHRKLACSPAAVRGPPRGGRGGAAGHHAAVVAVARHPVFTKYFLTCGDWSTRVWSEDVRTTLITSPYQPSALTAGRWSPTR